MVTVHLPHSSNSIYERGWNVSMNNGQSHQDIWQCYAEEVRLFEGDVTEKRCA